MSVSRASITKFPRAPPGIARKTRLVSDHKLTPSAWFASPPSDLGSSISILLADPYSPVLAMTRARTATTSGVSSAPTLGSHAKGSKDAGKKKKPKSKLDLSEQVLLLGGDNSDLALLDGVRDEGMVQGGQEEDVCSLPLSRCATSERSLYSGRSAK